MCIEIKYKGERLENIGDAMRAIGADKMVIIDGYPLASFQAEDCLCHLDVDATAKALGCTVDRDDSGELVFLKENANG